MNTLSLLALLACSSDPAVTEPAVTEPAVAEASAAEVPAAEDAAEVPAAEDAVAKAPATGSTPGEALDAALSERLGQPATLAGEWKQAAGYALLRTASAPTRPDGAAIDWSTVEGGGPHPDLDNVSFALARQEGDAWAVVELQLFCNDVCWADWGTTHPGAAAVLP